MSSPFFKSLLLTLPILIAGCTANKSSTLPSDFSFIMDVRTPEMGSASHIHIAIDAKGRGQYEVYNPQGVIQYDQNDILTYDDDQVLREGKFNLTPDEQEKLWTAIHQNQFFDLTEDYRMAIGHSYAFIMIEAEGNKHIVDNIGMEVPHIRALVQATDAVLPDDLDLEYGEGYVP